jgi:hypothetical protein
MAIVINKRIQDDRLSIRPHLLCVGTARRSLTTACGPTAQSSEPIFPPPFPHTQKKRKQSTGIAAASSAFSVTSLFNRKTHLHHGFQAGMGFEKLLQQSRFNPQINGYLSPTGFTLPQSGPL